MGAIKASLLKAKALYTGFVAGAPAIDNATLNLSGGILSVKSGGVDTPQLSEAFLDTVAADGVTLDNGGADGSLEVAPKGIDLAQLADDVTGAADGLGVLRCARATYDATNVAGLRTIASHLFGPTIPDEAIVVGGFIFVKALLDSADHSGSFAIHLQSANDIVTAAAINGEPWSANNTVEDIAVAIGTPDGYIELTAAAQLSGDVTTTALTVGTVIVYLYYVMGS